MVQREGVALRSELAVATRSVLYRVVVRPEGSPSRGVNSNVPSPYIFNLQIYRREFYVLFSTIKYWVGTLPRAHCDVVQYTVLHFVG